MAPYSFETALPSIPLSNANDALLLDSSALTEQQADLATMKLARRKKLQRYLSQIKQLVRQKGNSTEKRMTTLDALDKALKMLQQLNQASNEEQNSSTTKTSSSSSTSTPLPEKPNSLSPSSELKPYSPQSASIDLVQSGQAMLGRRLLGSLTVTLPEGTVLDCRDSAPSVKTEERLLSEIIQSGDSLLTLLHGKGAQTLLLNAFCGHPKRRMYARLKWENSSIRACELICEFSVDPQSLARRLANIQLFCLQSAGFLGEGAQLTFTTRHNSACALIYLDSASIPLLGHFPSEVTGKSLFELIHPDDVQLLKDAHQQLHSTGGSQIVRIHGLRLITHSGQSVTVESEWAAFVNPWTRQIEMVVGKHTFLSTKSPTVEPKLKKHLKKENEEQSLVENNGIMSKEHREEESAITAERLLSNQKQQLELPHQVSLSYNQINCLENVHRLLKSQFRAEEKGIMDGVGEERTEVIENEIIQIGMREMPSLTKEMLLQHNQRWEEECQDSWRKRLSARAVKRRQSRSEEGQPNEASDCQVPYKQMRRASEGGLAQKSHNESNFGISQWMEQGQVLEAEANILQAKGNSKFAFSQQFAQLNHLIQLQQHPTLVEQLLHAVTGVRGTFAIRAFNDNDHQKCQSN